MPWSRLFGSRDEPDESMDEIRANLATGKAVMLDVRTQEEWDAGYLKDAILIPIADIKSLPAGTTDLDGLVKDKIVYCH